MSEYDPLSSIGQLETLDKDDCLAGYYSGLDGNPEPGSDKSKSYWHGWRNGMMDRGLMPIDDSARKLAQEYVRRSRAH